MGLGIHGPGPSFLPRPAGGWQKGTGFSALVLCDPPPGPIQEITPQMLTFPPPSG